MARVIQRRRRADAFTLIELLAVIAILVAILLPALQRARESAYTARCLSNLQQIGIGIQLYANESRGWFPSPGPNRDFRLAANACTLTWPERLVLAGCIEPIVPDTRWT